MKLLISQCSSIAGLAFPDKGGFIPTPGCKVSVETVERKICLTTNKLFRLRRLPFKHFVPSFEPVELFSHSSPEGFRIGRGFGSQLFQFGHRLDMPVLRELDRGRENSILSKDGINVGNSRHNKSVYHRTPYRTTLSEESLSEIQIGYD